jgi:hypothetical protein
MATASAAIDSIADVTGIPQATVFRGARALREADTSLWPQGAAGRGRAAHVEPEHLVNIVLGLATADPLTEAAERAAVYRSLVLGECRLSEDMEIAGQILTFWTNLRPNKLLWPRTILPGRTLGEGFVALVDELANPAAKPLRDLYAASSMTISLIVDRVPSGFTRLAVGGGKIETNEYVTPSPSLLAAAPRAPLKRETTIPFSLIEVLADLWADTLGLPRP